MIIDKECLLSDDQAITASAASTNVIDLGAEGARTTTPNEKCGYLFAFVTVTFLTLTSLSVGLQTDSDEAFGTVETVFTTAAIAAAALVAGYKFKIGELPEGLSRYIRLYYTVAGSNATAGKISAGIALDVQSKQ